MYKCGLEVGDAYRAHDRLQTFPITNSSSAFVITAVRLKSDRWPQEIVCAPVIAFVVGNDLKSK